MSRWRIRAQPDDIDRLRDEDAFAEILTLGRVANMLRATMTTGFTHAQHDGSAAERERIAMFLLMSGIVTEALPVLQRCGKYFRHLPGFTPQITPILSDPTLSDLRKRWLAPVRNQAVFHNDPVVSISGIATLSPKDPQDIARGDSDLFFDVYYPLADTAAVAYVINSAGAGAEPAEFLITSLSKCLDLAKRICVAIDTLVGQALDERGFVLEEESD